MGILLVLTLALSDSISVNIFSNMDMLAFNCDLTIFWDLFSRCGHMCISVLLKVVASIV